MAKVADATPFLVKVAQTLKSVGLDARTRYDRLEIGDVKFAAAEAYDKKDHIQVKFLESSFKVTGTEENPQFDLGRAVGLVIAELPKLINAQQQESAEKRNRAVARKFANEDQRYDDVLQAERWMHWYKVGEAFVAGKSDGIHVRARVDTEEQAKKLLELLNSEFGAEIFARP